MVPAGEEDHDRRQQEVYPDHEHDGLKGLRVEPVESVEVQHQQDIQIQQDGHSDQQLMRGADGPYLTLFKTYPARPY